MENKTEKETLFARLTSHKKLWLLLLAAVGAVVLAFAVQSRLSGQKSTQGTDLSYIRTTTLTRTTLADTVSATGLVESADVSNVTTNLNESVKSVSVAVGDYVEAGDVICTLDTSEIEKQIARAEESLADQIETAQDNYSKAVKRYKEAQETLEDYEDEASDLRKTYREAKSDYESAVSQTKTLRTDAEDAEKEASDAASDYINAQSAAKKAKKALEEAAEALAAEEITEEEYAEIETAYDEAAELEETTGAAYEKAQALADEAAAELKTLETKLGYSALESVYEKTKSAYDAAKDKYENYESTVDDRADDVEDAKKNLEKAQKSDTLEDLRDSLEDYTLRAETSGYVTALNATVGSRLSESTVATIQDTENLIVTISIAEYDIDSVELGMRAIITSDSVDGEIEGELTQIAPVASGGMSSSATFSAEVSVLGGSHGLLIGVNAKVQLVLSSTDDVFVVPIDAIGQNDAGESIVYVKQGGEGTDVTFEEIPVTTGDSTDYYIEISGDGLEEGMQVRASADLTEATFTVSEDEQESADAMFSPGMGSVGQATNGGGFSGGGMGGPPSGGGMGPGGR